MPAGPDKPSMYCRRCRYVLDGLPDRRCPECGTDFDPDDPSTMWQRPEQSWRWEPFEALGCLLLGWTAGGFEARGGVSLGDLLPGIIGVAFGVGLGISGCRRGRSSSRALSALALLLNVLMGVLIVMRWG